MKPAPRSPLFSCFATSLLSAHLVASHANAASADVQIEADDIGGVVSSAKGREAGVWVQAECLDRAVALFCENRDDSPFAARTVAVSLLVAMPG